MISLRLDEATFDKVIEQQIESCTRGKGFSNKRKAIIKLVIVKGESCTTVAKQNEVTASYVRQVVNKFIKFYNTVFDEAPEHWVTKTKTLPQSIWDEIELKLLNFDKD